MAMWTRFWVGMFRNCFIELNVEELAKIGAVLSNSGRDPNSGKQLVEKRDYKSCTFIDDNVRDVRNKWTIFVANRISGKERISGGIMAVVPKKCGIATYAPRLDETGNSIREIKSWKNLLSMTLNMFVE